MPLLMTQVRTYAQTIVKVPQMAESITEGTLKQWNKKVGDYVVQDEEIATIETDKVRRHGKLELSCLVMPFEYILVDMKTID